MEMFRDPPVRPGQGCPTKTPTRLTAYSGVFLSYEMPETVIEVIRGIPMVEDYPTKAKIQIAENSFTHGGSARN
ncbi:hypothetical protein Ddc_18461 [Ditylenchus destructor]|nr:hypothetical protein Ddc_18461 [Ditylenchus destructor]